MKELSIVIGLTIAALLVGWAWGEMGWSLFFASLIWIALQLGEYRKVLAWSRRPLSRPQNGLDSWFALAYPAFRALIRERRRTKAMNTQLREVLGLAEVIPDGVIILNHFADIEGLNKAAKGLLQLSDSDIGLGLATVVRQPDFVAFIRSDSREDPMDFTSPFDPERTLEARRFDTGTGRTVVLIRDITALNRLLTMRQNFVANVSHELRTPLTVMSGYLETMTDVEQATELRLSLIERLQAPVNRMKTLVADLMLLTQLESTSSEEQQRPTDLSTVIRDAVSEMQGLCSSPDQIQFTSDCEAMVMGIDSELHSVCVNLLSNAIRYSPEGRPISISLTDRNGSVRLEVRDQGYGIAPEHLSRLTERFYRVDLAGARSRGGTGLGLAIVKHVLRRHKSELFIESSLGRGSRFYCDFATLKNLPNQTPFED